MATAQQTQIMTRASWGISLATSLKKERTEKARRKQRGHRYLLMGQWALTLAGKERGGSKEGGRWESEPGLVSFPGYTYHFSTMSDRRGVFHRKPHLHG